MAAAHGLDARVALPEAHGKFLYRGLEKFYVRGVTYGTFRPDDSGHEFYDREVVAADFAAMAGHGINAVRTYTVPPRWLLDLAEGRGLRVLVGIPWEQHVAFLSDRGRARSIVQRVKESVTGCAGHPAILGYVVGNEIPAPIVRWHGRKRVEHFLEDLYLTAKDEDPDALVTYVNYPSTEYLDLPFLDLCAFNVYLESPDELTAYLARLQNMAGDKPLVLAEVGLDSHRNGEATQAASLRWQTSTAFAAGCAGTFVFAWTDEWYRGGHDIDDWDFGLTDRQRQPKAALRAIEAVYANVPFPHREWPRVSAVVCTHNGSHTIRETCEGLLDVDYPDLEVIVVDDGSTDATPTIIERYPFRVIRTEHLGLSAARNVGAAAATGTYVVYLDDDAWPDPHWSRYLVHTFEQGGFAAVGGPNIPPPDESETAQCVARAPGGPTHVLMDDVRAEHVPGCSFAVRRSVLEELGGFDPHFRVAGDDVDFCWRIHESGDRIGFSPGAVVWHRRRGSVRAYYRQQRGYGRAEALLERKWPERYNSAGHPTWSGRVYGPGGVGAFSARRSRIYYGTWGMGLFQRLYHPPASLWASLPATPEWWLLIAALAALSLLGVLWHPLLLFAPVLLIALGLVAIEAVRGAWSGWRGEQARTRLRLLTAALFLIQPVARLVGRIEFGLRPWWPRAAAGFALPLPREVTVWSEQWRPHADRVGSAESAIRALGNAPRRGGDYDGWDLEIRAGLLGAARVRHVVEEHGEGRQLVRFRVAPRLSPAGIALPALFALLALAAAESGAVSVALVVGGLAAGALLLAVREVSIATALALHGAERCGEEDDGRVLLERIYRSREETLGVARAVD